MTTKHISSFCIAAFAALALASCDKDGDMLTINPGENVAVEVSAQDIVLDFENLNALALTLNWGENGNLVLSNPAVALPDGVLSNSIEIALNDNFDSPVATNVAAGSYSYQFTVAELNTVMSRLGVPGGQRSEVFVRIKSTVGKNIEPTYSNVLSLFVTPYKIDYTSAFILNKQQEMTDNTLASPEEDGVYRGFVGVSGWENWYLKDATGAIWGNSASRGTFAIASSASGEEFWNMWYPGTPGCYFTTVNTNEQWWSALSIPALTVAGDIEGTMEFNWKQCVWTLAVDVPAGSKNITISGLGTLYDMSTGDSSSSLTQTVALAGTPDDLRYSETASTITVDVPTSGAQVMTLSRVAPLQWKVEFGAGSVEPVEPVRDLLYLSGHDDGVSGSWHFNNYLRLYNEDELAYAGAVYFSSLLGYKLYKEADNWDDAWGLGDEGDATSGNLAFGSSNNIPAPDAGLYILNVGLDALTYETTAVNSVSYAGLNDDWSVKPMSATDTAGVFSAVVEKTANTPWGVKILINESWSVFFGGGNGTLLYGHDGFDGDNDLANGTYLLTVDLVNGTYSYSNL